MKTSHSLLMSLALLTSLFLEACKKEETSLPHTLKVTSTADNSIPSLVPDGASFKIKLVKDAHHSDEVDFVFRQSFSPAYVVNEDVLYFSAGGQASLSSISSDGRDLAINGLPYTKGMSIALNVNTSAPEGTFYLQNSYKGSIPANIHVWLKDTYLKDSVDIFKVNYNFKMDPANANSIGRNRFKLIIRN